jgi:hypothetical protein
MIVHDSLFWLSLEACKAFSFVPAPEYLLIQTGMYCYAQKPWQSGENILLHLYHEHYLIPEGL